MPEASSAVLPRKQPGWRDVLRFRGGGGASLRKVLAAVLVTTGRCRGGSVTGGGPAAIAASWRYRDGTSAGTAVRQQTGQTAVRTRQGNWVPSTRADYATYRVFKLNKTLTSHTTLSNGTNSRLRSRRNCPESFWASGKDIPVNIDPPV